LRLGDRRVVEHSERMSALFRGAGIAAFDGLYRRHAATVYRYAFAVLGNHADAEDVTQQTFLNAYRSLAQGTKPRKAENWLLTIAHNEVRSHFRSVRSKPREVELDDQLAQPAGERADPSVADVLRALQRIPPAQRSAIVMREFEGRSYAEIAQILNVTPSALEALIFRARRSLTEQLEDTLTCADAEQALSRDLDGRLGRREARRLKAHLRECPRCARFRDVQKRQRTLLKGITVLPVPASLFLFRGESAAAATGLGVGTAAATATATGGGSGLLAIGGAGVATGIVGKAAAVTAAAAVAGGVGYQVAHSPDPTAKAERKAAHFQAVAQTRNGGRAAVVHAAHALGERPGPAATASARAHEVAVTRTTARKRTRGTATKKANQPAAASSHVRGKPLTARVAVRRPAPNPPKANAAKSRPSQAQQPARATTTAKQQPQAASKAKSQPRAVTKAPVQRPARKLGVPPAGGTSPEKATPSNAATRGEPVSKPKPAEQPESETTTAAERAQGKPES
jgi:RNA polymerase sigma factor (sigma-70 family)